MKKDKIFSHIEEEKFDLIIEYFKENKSTFKNYQKYTKRFIDFLDWLPSERENFKSILKEYIIEEIDEYAALNEDDSLDSFDYDKLMYNLFNFNFKHQTDYFNSLVKSNKSFLSFIIWSKEQNHGQSWLLNKLIFHYQVGKPLHTNIIIDLNRVDKKLEDLIYEIGISLGIALNVNDRNNDKKIRKAIESRLATKSQIFIFKNAYNFIHSEYFDDFIAIFTYFHDEINGTTPKHKCIFFYLEEINCNPYTHVKYCLCSKQVKALDARKIEDFKFIDLEEIEPICGEDFEPWLNNCPTEVADLFPDYHTDNFERNELIGDGNPAKVIPAMYDKIANHFKIDKKLEI